MGVLDYHACASLITKFANLIPNILYADVFKIIYSRCTIEELLLLFGLERLLLCNVYKYIIMYPALVFSISLT